MNSRYDLIQGDCLEVMKTIPDGSVDMVLCDLPYGTTGCKWDVIIPFEPLWQAYHRVCKKNAAIVLTASQPFTSVMVMNNLRDFRYSLVWEKTTASGHLNAKKQPMRAHEDVIVFSVGTPHYFPQKTTGHRRKTALRVDRAQKLSDCYGSQQGITSYDSTERYPRSVIKTSTDRQKSRLHPTQKPVTLMEYLIRTYTNEGQIVLDNTMGSGTTGVACMNTGRRFIGIERDAVYFEKAKTRIEAAEMVAENNNDWE